MSLSQEDYAMVMKTLTQNMGEGTPPPTAKSASASSPTITSGPTDEPTAAAGGQSRIIVAAQTHGVQLAPTAKDAPPPPANRTEFDIVIEGLTACLYTGTSNLVLQLVLLLPFRCLRNDESRFTNLQYKGIVRRKADAALASLVVKQLVVRGAMKDDGFLGVNVHLANFLLDDKRIAQTGITR